jgi:hypothetical protein
MCELKAARKPASTHFVSRDKGGDREIRKSQRLTVCPSVRSLGG